LRKPSVLVIDYGMGNLASVSKALEVLGARVVVSSRVSAMKKADGVVLPGVGAFREAMKRLNRLGFVRPLREWTANQRPFLGICLGYQLMFGGSSEFGRTRGLGILPGRVVKFRRVPVIPHMGWNILRVARGSRLLKGLPQRPFVYFVHSYYPVPADRSVVAATTPYGGNFASAAEDGVVAGVQFHPEKSQRVGMKVLRNFIATVESSRKRRRV
jgi:glutamine amidotransferase